MSDGAASFEKRHPERRVRRDAINTHLDSGNEQGLAEIVSIEVPKKHSVLRLRKFHYFPMYPTLKASNTSIIS